MRFGAWPVQIHPAYKPLVEEAIKFSTAVSFDGVPTNVFTPEYLCAIAIDTGRVKDYYRVAMFIEQHAVDIKALKLLLKRFDLQEKTKNIQNWTDDEPPAYQ